MNRVAKLQSTLKKFSWDFYMENINSLDSFTTRYYHYHRVKESIRFFLTIVSQERYKRIKTCLDIGCNRGYYSTILGQLGIKVDAIDLHLNKPLLLKHSNVKYFKRDILDWNPKKKYDLIIMFEVYEHLEVQNRSKLMRKILDLLNHDGIFLFSGPNCISPHYGFGQIKQRIKKFRRKIRKIDWHFRLHSFYYNHLLKGIHFDVIKWKTNGLFLVYSNKLEKLLPKRILLLLIKIDDSFSKIFKGFGANYFCISRKISSNSK